MSVVSVIYSYTPAHCYTDSMKNIHQTYVIKAPVYKVQEALTNAELINKWNAGPAKFDISEGGAFSLWGGDIYGTNTKVVTNELLEQDWYSGDAEQCYMVSFRLNEANGNTTVILEHNNVPNQEAKDFAEGWRDFYFDPIKQLLENK